MRLLIRARNRTVAVEDGRIAPPDGGFDLDLEFAGALVLPGLINAHEHLHRNHYGRLGHPPYPNAYAWAADIQSTCAPAIAEGRGRARREALLEGAWKNLFSGVTTVVHHDPWEPDFEDGFPIRVARLDCADSLGMSQEIRRPEDGSSWCLHLAEGVDATAAGEVHELAERGLLSSELIAVHGVGMDAAAVRRFRGSGAALVWCPSSNRFLFGQTAPGELLAEGVDVLIGSDSRLTGEGDLLEEIGCAAALGLLDETRIEAGVGSLAARRLGLPEPSLAIGSAADLMVVARPLPEARAEDVLLVLVGGVPRVAHPTLGPALSPFVDQCREMTVGKVVRWTSPGAVEGRSVQ